jgi:hypothetical protein
MQLVETYNKYKNVIFCAKNYLEEKKCHLKFVCKCNQEVTVTGATSHSAKCDYAYKSKVEFLINKFNLEINCPVCLKKLCYDKKNRIERHGYLNFCSSKCKRKAVKFVSDFEKFYKKCEICNKFDIMRSKTCSRDCYLKLLSKTTKNAWKTCASEKKEKRIKLATAKFAETRKKFRSWNAGLHGEEFLKHYEKSDGTNSLFEAIKKNFYYKKLKLRNVLRKF